MQKSVRYNEGHALYLSMIARKEGTKRGYLCKKATENNRWTEKFFALHQNVLFYFENEQSSRPSGMYLLEGSSCERIPAPKVSATGKESSDKAQVRPEPQVKEDSSSGFMIQSGELQLAVAIFELYSDTIPIAVEQMLLLLTHICAGIMS
ncbi:hypothetical protein DNTS_026565 [Danionella cerebrum]|uniref:PH domain-containing protein n=1 Tax=Danionella cerebrum TaxID=2873325 RepID=A0A553NGY9_9TELE|nr:hypothetical protein DNTS_026565 [Danionella translucida]